MTQATDKELAAIQILIEALQPLSAAARARVVAYVFGRFDIRAPLAEDVRSSSAESTGPSSAPAPGPSDIRSLKEAKQPRSANEMAALVAYYLSELAPGGERRDSITTDDLKVYFKQAGYPLPKQPRFTLKNAKNAGYFESTGDSGVYRLNPVGYNLVAHSLPAGSGPPSGRRKAKRLKRPGKRSKR